MRTYIYTDHNQARVTQPTVVFTCQAEDILEADKKLKEATGMIAAKESWVLTYSPDWGKNEEEKGSSSQVRT